MCLGNGHIQSLGCFHPIALKTHMWRHFYKNTISSIRKSMQAVQKYLCFLRIFLWMDVCRVLSLQLFMLHDDPFRWYPLLQGVLIRWFCICVLPAFVSVFVTVFLCKFVSIFISACNCSCLIIHWGDILVSKTCSSIGSMSTSLVYSR